MTSNFTNIYKKLNNIKELFNRYNNDRDFRKEKSAKHLTSSEYKLNVFPFFFIKQRVRLIIIFFYAETDYDLLYLQKFKKSLFV